MSNSQPPGDADVAHHLQRNEVLMRDLNARIARLAIGLGVPLQSEQDITEAIHSLRHPALAEERRSGEDRRGGGRSSGPDRRVSYQREELRGLLVIRYGVELRLVDQLGFTVTQEIMHGVELRLERRGIHPEAYGERPDWHDASE